MNAILQPDDPGARFVVFDQESTGTDPRKDRIISIGAVAVRDGDIWLGDVFDEVVKVEGITPAVLVHGITPQKSQKGKPEAEAVAEFLDYIGPAVLVGHHVGFDVGILAEAAKRLGRTVPNVALDTMRITIALADAGAFGSEEVTRFDLDGLCQRFKVTPHDRHTAPGDAFMTAQIFLRQLPLCRTYKLRLNDLVEKEEAN